jgi:hypothetical protein
MAVDLNGYGKKENVMWIVEQIPGETITQDVTSFLYKDVGLGKEGDVGLLGLLQHPLLRGGAREVWLQQAAAGARQRLLQLQSPQHLQARRGRRDGGK